MPRQLPINRSSTTRLTSRKNYQLTSNSVQSVCRNLAASRSFFNRLKPIGVYVLSGDSASSDIGRNLEREVFEHYFGNSAEVMFSEYGKYENQSEFVVVVDHLRQMPVGVVRLMKHGVTPVKTIVDVTHHSSPWQLTKAAVIKHHDIKLESVWDIATIAVKRKYRSRMYRRYVKALLLHSIYLHAIRNSALHWVALLDDIHLNSFIDLGIPVDTINDSSGKPYLGSKSTTPVIVDISKVKQGILQKSRFTHSFLIDGYVHKLIASFS